MAENASCALHFYDASTDDPETREQNDGPIKNKRKISYLSFNADALLGIKFVLFVLFFFWC